MPLATNIIQSSIHEQLQNHREKKMKSLFLTQRDVKFQEIFKHGKNKLFNLKNWPWEKTGFPPKSFRTFPSLHRDRYLKYSMSCTGNKRESMEIWEYLISSEAALSSALAQNSSQLSCKPKSKKRPVDFSSTPAMSLKQLKTTFTPANKSDKWR